MDFRIAAAPVAFLLLAAQQPAGTLDVSIERLRNQRGVLHLCLTRNPAHFPDCGSDPQALKRTIAAGGGPIRFGGIAPGGYALSVFHDENRNGRLDTLLGIPREGFGFSRNPVIRFGAPRFGQVSIDLGPGFARQTVRMQYLL
jgi:uncharacterized protein (DUF2141 family)